MDCRRTQGCVLDDERRVASITCLPRASSFALDGPLALLLTIVVWVCSMVSKIFCYLRAGMLPILVGVAPVWAAMSWTESGRQAFSRIMGWLVAFLLYKPVAALVMATGCAIMSTAGASDDSEAITLMLTISTIVLLPAMVKLVAPAVASSVAGGGQGLMGGVLGGIAGASVTLAGKAMMGGGKAAAGSLRSAFRSGGTPQGAKPAAATTGATAAAVCPGPVAEKMSRPRLVVSGRGLRWNPSHRKVHPAPLPLPAALRHHRHISLNRLHRQPHHRYRRCPEGAASAASSAPPMPSTAAPRHAASNPPLPSGARATGVPGASAEPQGARNGKAKQEHGKEF